MIFIVSFGLNSAVAAACEEKRAFDQVRVLIGATLATGVPLGNSSRDGLARAVSQLNILAIFPVLAANNQAMHAPFLKNVLDEVALLVLAPYGARFIPLADDGSLDADDAMHGADVLHIEIGGRQLKVRLEAAMSEFSIVAFQTTLSRKELDALYAMSEILTRFASNVLFVKKRKPQTRDVRERNANPKMRKAPAL